MTGFVFVCVILNIPRRQNKSTGSPVRDPELTHSGGWTLLKTPSRRVPQSGWLLRATPLGAQSLYNTHVSSAKASSPTGRPQHPRLWLCKRRVKTIKTPVKAWSMTSLNTHTQLKKWIWGELLLRMFLRLSIIKHMHLLKPLKIGEWS